MFDQLDEYAFGWAEASSMLKHYELLFSFGFINMIGKEDVREKVVPSLE